MKEFISWWSHLSEHISPVVFRMGSIEVHYYGLMYLVAFAICYLFILNRIKKENTGFSKAVIDNYFTWLILAVLIGGRLGYVLFYDFSYYLKHPFEVILPFDINNGLQYIGLYGMSYHGALIGVIIATVIFCRSHKLSFWLLADLFALVVSLGYTFGRLGNFINGELYGRVTSVPWGMYFSFRSYTSIETSFSIV